MTWHTGPLATLDFEATGVDPLTDRVVSVAALGPDRDTADRDTADRDGAAGGTADARGVGVVGDLVGLVNPGVPIPERSAAVHGIRDADVATAPTAPVAIAEIVDWLNRLIAQRAVLVVYNAPYDLTMLRAEAARHGVAQPDWEQLVVVDPLVLDWAADRYRRGKRTLTITAEHYGVALDQAHEARADASAARELVRAIALKHEVVGSLGTEQLMSQQRDWFSAKTTSWNEWARSKGGDIARRQDDPNGWPLARA